MEALLIIVVFAVAAVAYVYAKFSAQSPIGGSAADELVQLEQCRAALLETSRRGQKENWDGVMMNQMADRLAEIDRRIAQVANQG